MSYPQPPYGQQPQGPYYPPQPQPGYGYPAQPGYPQAPQQGYGQAFAGVDWTQAYQQADMSGGPSVTLPKGDYPATCTEAEWEIAQSGKGMWRCRFTISAGQYQGTLRTFRIVVAPFKADGSPNPKGMGAMFRRLAVLGIPAPSEAPQMYPPANTTPEQQAPQMGQIARMMAGRQVILNIGPGRDEYADRDEVKDILPVQGQQQAAPPQTAPQPVQGGGAGPYQGPPVTPGQPYGWPQAPQGQQAPGPWQQAQPGPQTAQPYLAPSPEPAGAPGVPQPPAGPPPSSGVPAPPWAQQPAPAAVPGAGGTGEFTANGQSAQPGIAQQAQGQPNPGQPPWLAQP